MSGKLGKPTKSKERHTRIINIYNQRRNNPYHYSLWSTDWNKVLAPRTILAGDFNSRSPNWDIHSQEIQGDNRVPELIDDFNLILNNTQGVTTRKATRQNSKIESTLDLTLSTSQMGYLASWTVESEFTTPSDHEVITFSWNSLQDEATPAVPILWNLSLFEKNQDLLTKAKDFWTSKLPTSRLPNLNTPEQINREVQKIENTLFSTLDQFAPRINITPRSKRWWNQEIKDKHQQFMRQKRLFAQGRLSPKEYKKARNEYYTLIRREKRQLWEKYLQCEEDTSQTREQQTSTQENMYQTTKQVSLQTRCWQALRYCRPKVSTNTTSFLEIPKEQDTQDNQEKFKITSIEDKEKVFLKQAFPGKHEPSLIIQETPNKAEITMEKLEEALFSLPTQTTPGCDKLSFRTIKNAWKWDSTRLVHLYKACISIGYYPERWKIATGIIIPKPKKPPSNPRSYRVISLLNCFGKLLEKTIASYLANQLDHKLFPLQFGGRAKRSTSDALLCLVNTVEKAWKQKNIAIGLMMDIKGAFDHVSRNDLIHTLAKLGVQSNLLRWIFSFLSKRQATLIIDNFLCPTRKVYTGLPQGSPLSPFLWAIYIHQMFLHLQKKFPESVNPSIVDDITLIIEEKTLSEAIILAEEVSTEIIHWGNQHNLDFELPKSEAILFTRSRKIRKEAEDKEIKIGGTEKGAIKIKTEATKWLGFWLDPALTFNHHKKIRFQQAKNAINQLSTLSKCKGLPAKLIRNIQFAVPIAIALYGAEIWWKNQPTIGKELQILLNQSARAITGHFKSTPIPKLLQNANMPRAEDLLNKRQARFTIRCLKLPQTHPSFQTLPVTFRNGELPLINDSYPSSDIQWISNKPSGIGKYLASKLATFLPPSTKPLFQSYGCEQFSRSTPVGTFSTQYLGEKNIHFTDRSTKRKLLVFTDASAMPHKEEYPPHTYVHQFTGAGITYQHPLNPDQWLDFSLPVGTQKEVLDAELYAIYQALKCIPKTASWLRNCPIPREIQVYSDSATGLHQLQNQGISGPIVLEIQNLARCLQNQGFSLNFTWIPGHKGIAGNERADELAKFAANQASKGKMQEDFPEATISYLKAMVSKAQAYSPIPKLLATARRDLAMRFFQLASNHAHLGKYLHRIQKKGDSQCLDCNKSEGTTNHSLFHCRKWRTQRRQLFRDFRKNGLQTVDRSPAAQEELFHNVKAIPAILYFLDSTTVAMKPYNSSRSDEWDIEKLDS